MRRYNSSHDIAGLKIMFRALFLGLGAWEASFIHPAHLAILLTHCPNQPRTNVLPSEKLWCRWANIRCIQPVRFWNPTPFSIPLGASAGTCLDGQSSSLQAFVERPPRIIGGGSIFKRGLRLDMGEPEFMRCLVAFLLVALLTGQRQITHPMTAPAHFRHDVFDLQGYARSLAVRALMAPLEQQVFFQLIARQGAVLVFCSLNFRILQGLGIEARRLVRNSTQRAPPRKPRYPGLDVLNATFQ